MYSHISLPHPQIKEDILNTRPLNYKFNCEDIKCGREFLQQLDEALINYFKLGISVSSLLAYRTYYIDLLLTKLFEHFNLHQANDLCLIAVGGYGRAELFLRSDIDILLLSKNNIEASLEEQIAKFISYLWDLKLDLGSSVRTIKETIDNANHDLSICTNLLETRFICGNQLVYQAMLDDFKLNSTWNTNKFFHAKVDEELERHHAYKDTAYSLEPDLKHNPGGIRDIHVMQWIANFHFQAKTPEEMLKLQFLSQEEYDELIECRDALYQVRYALHICTLKEDNRLTLDNQPSVAELLGYVGNHNERAENMMRDLYRSLRRIRELNSMTLQIEVLRITGHLGDDAPQFVSNDFIRRGMLIDVTGSEVFFSNQSKLLEIFLIMSRQDDIAGLHVHCLRLLRKARRSLNNYLVEIPECRKIFKAILDNPHSAFSALPLMHEHRLLSSYMPAWEKIEGLSQFDMFHSFTVDEHTIRVIKNIEILSQSKEPMHNLFKNVYSQISNPEILIVAALLHDIAKGQGGHHSQLGAGEALYFCQLHKYTLYQTRLVSWLVYNHLLMSRTATRRDINDPQVVNEFSKLVQDEEHLNLLYCLTVADISATNDHEWTSWKDQVFRQLYFSTRQALRHGLEMPHDIKLHANENQDLALSYLKDLNEQQIRSYWSYYQTSYFIYYTPQELAWHTRNILNYQNIDKPLILFAQLNENFTDMLIYVKGDKKYFNFGYLAYIMAKKKLNVRSAQFIHNGLNHRLCTVKFQSQKAQCIDNDRLHSIRQALLNPENIQKPSVELAQSLANNNTKSVFKLPSRVNFIEDLKKEASNLEISTLDRQGLLAIIGIIFGQFNILVKSARITTTGERADDFFAITDKQGRPLSDRVKDKLTNALIEALDQRQVKDKGFSFKFTKRK